MESINQKAQSYAAEVAVDEADRLKAAEDYSAGFEAGMASGAAQLQFAKAALRKILNTAETRYEMASATLAEDALKQLGVPRHE